MDKIKQFWDEFIKDTGRSSSTVLKGYFHFELTEKLANELLELVLKGKKQATASSKYAFDIEKEPLPKIGDFWIITDWEGNPHCVIETTNISIIPFKEITYDICRREGEDDNLETWRNGHKRFYENEGNMLGYKFTETMPVVFEDFKCVYKK